MYGTVVKGAVMFCAIRVIRERWWSMIERSVSDAITVCRSIKVLVRRVQVALAGC